MQALMYSILTYFSLRKICPSLRVVIIRLAWGWTTCLPEALLGLIYHSIPKIAEDGGWGASSNN